MNQPPLNSRNELKFESYTIHNHLEYREMGSMRDIPCTGAMLTHTIQTGIDKERNAV